MNNPAPLDACDDKSRIKLGEYIVLQKGNFLKIHQLSKNGNVMLGRDKIDLTNIIGQNYWSNFKMIHKKGSQREFELVACDKSESLLKLMDKDARGIDNRNIRDDGSSQSLSAEEIIELRDKGCTGQDIVGHLLENSKTFHFKTEYSQQKYLKKKEKKYFEYVIIHRPNIRIISQILYSKDPQKILNLRFDTLAQIVTAVNLQPSGNYILFENGCQGLVSALILNQLGGNGNLIHLFPNQHYQKHAVLAMNFGREELNSFISIRLSTFINKMFSSPDKSNTSASVIENSCNMNEVILTNSKKELTDESVDVSLNQSDLNSLDLRVKENILLENDKSCSDKIFDNFKSKNDDSKTLLSTTENLNKNGELLNQKLPTVSTERNTISEDINRDKVCVDELSNENEVDTDMHQSNSIKRKLSESKDNIPVKKFKWEIEVSRAADLLSAQKADGLIIVCKDYPIYLINKLIKFVAFSRNIIIYSMYQEPLVKLYCELKLRRDVIGLRLTESFLRNYQVLPDRTHPEINMSSSGGFLLTATVVSSEDSSGF